MKQTDLLKGCPNISSVLQKVPCFLLSGYDAQYILLLFLFRSHRSFIHSTLSVSLRYGFCFYFVIFVLVSLLIFSDLSYFSFFFFFVAVTFIYLFIFL